MCTEIQTGGRPRQKKRNRPARKEMDRTKQQRNMKILSVVVGAVLCVVFIPVLILNLAMIFKGLSQPNDVPDLFGICSIIETTDLMEGGNSPIKNGDMLFFKKGDYDYKQGDTDGTIVAIKAPNNTVVVRRLIASTADAQGNVKYVAIAENKAESTRMEITTDDIIGALTFRIATLGDFVLFSHRPLGTFLTVVLPLVLLFILLYFVYWYDRRTTAKRVSTTPAAATPYGTALLGAPYIDEDADEYVIAEVDYYLDENGKTVAKKVKK